MDILRTAMIEKGALLTEHFDLSTLRHERIASRCVCCGSTALEASPAILMPFVADRVFGWKPVTIDESWGLRTVPQGNAFSICKTLYCRDCGHLFCDIRFSDSEMAALYDHYREDAYAQLRDFYEPGYAARNAALNQPISYIPEIESFLRPYLKAPLTVLDWGGDTGINTPFKGEAAKVDIFDISNKDVEPGVRSVTREQALGSAYALIISSMVLEHVPYPADVLLEARGAMDADSVLYIEVPCEELLRGGGDDYHRAKRHWHEHINFYSETSLQRLVENCGYEIIARNTLATEVAGSAVHIFQVACRLGPNR